MNRVEGPVTAIDASQAEDALITRPEMEVACVGSRREGPPS